MTATPGYGGLSGPPAPRVPPFPGPLFTVNLLALDPGELDSLFAPHVYAGDAYLWAYTAAANTADLVIMALVAVDNEGKTWTLDQYRTDVPGLQAPRTVKVPPVRLRLDLRNLSATPQVVNFTLTPLYVAQGATSTLA